MLRSVVILGLAVLLTAGTAHAAGPAGNWLGTMRGPDGAEFSVRVNLDGSGSSWTGTLVEAERDTLPLENLRITATRIAFTFRPGGGGVPAHFTGGYIAGDDRITGTFSMRGNSRFVKFDRAPGEDPTAAAAALEAAAPVRSRHPYRFGVTPRLSYWPAIHAVRDEVYTLNNLTTSQLNFDVALRYYVLDSFNVFVRYYRGGQGISDDPNKLAPFEPFGVNGSSTMTLDGYEFGVMGFLGKKIMSESRFNPYLTGTIGRVDWAVLEGDRGSAVIQLDRYALEGKDWSAAFGLGTEYELSSRVALEVEWLWRFFMTKDEVKWPDTDAVWKDTMAWSLSLGATVGF
jgi:hypothetical protein